MSTKLPFFIFLFFPTLLSFAAIPPEPAEKIAADAERASEHAGQCNDGAALADAIKSLDAALAVAPDQPALLYTRGYASYVASGLHRDPKGQAESERDLRDGVRFLERVKGAPWDAEAAAMQGAILGSLIRLQADPAQAGATLGPESSELLARSTAAAPDSPRVLVFRGQSLLFTPLEYGGDPAKGRELIQQAVDRFNAPGSKPPGPCWGRCNALAWLGFARKMEGDQTAARAAWQQALAIEPNYAWVKYVLLPSLDKPSAPR